MTAEKKTYNGWSNYETWNVALWIGNEEWSDSYWRERTQEVYDEAEADKNFTREERAALTLADQLKYEIEEAAPDLTPSMFSDLLNAALSEVDWHEIASNWLEDVDKADPEEDEETDDDTEAE
jgi:hypothetical protein